MHARTTKCLFPNGSGSRYLGALDLFHLLQFSGSLFSRGPLTFKMSHAGLFHWDGQGVHCSSSSYVSLFLSCSIWNVRSDVRPAACGGKSSSWHWVLEDYLHYAFTSP